MLAGLYSYLRGAQKRDHGETLSYVGASRAAQHLALVGGLAAQGGG